MKPSISKSDSSTSLKEFQLNVRRSLRQHYTFGLNLLQLMLMFCGIGVALILIYEFCQ